MSAVRTMTDPTLPSHSRRPARRAGDLHPWQWLLLVEALTVLAGTSLAIAVLPFRWIVRYVSRGSTSVRSSGDLYTIDDIRWTVEAVARRVPWRTVCFQKGLALHFMLRRRCVPSLLHYGVGKTEDGGLGAHVWVSVEGVIVMGGDVVGRFRSLATYPTVA